MISRRGFICGLASALAAPAVIRSGVLMPLRGIVMRPRPIFIDHGPFGFSVVDDVDWLAASEEVFGPLGYCAGGSSRVLIDGPRPIAQG